LSWNSDRENTKTSIPSDFKNLSFDLSGKNYTLTERTGEIISGENISDSLLNLKDKKAFHIPLMFTATERFTVSPVTLLPMIQRGHKQKNLTY
jgi:hypothetical protein